MAGALGRRRAARTRTAIVPRWRIWPAARCGSQWGRPAPIFRATEGGVGRVSIAGRTTRSAWPATKGCGRWVPVAASAAFGGDNLFALCAGHAAQHLLGKPFHALGSQLPQFFEQLLVDGCEVETRFALHPLA